MRTSVDQAGPYAVGNTTLEFHDEIRDRMLVIEAWYPSVDLQRPTSNTVDFERSETARLLLSEAYEAASQCPTRTTGSHRNSPLNMGRDPLPLVLVSHCFNCGRYSTFSLAERLASHGF